MTEKKQDNKGRILTLEMIETGLEENRKLSGYPVPIYPPWLANKLKALANAILISNKEDETTD